MVGNAQRSNVIRMNVDQLHLQQIESKARAIGELFQDPSHDFLHIQRVVKNAIDLQKIEGGDLNIILPAAYLHDFLVIQKDDPRRKQASLLSADAAIEYLNSINYPQQFQTSIHHAIHAHSFSAKIEPQTIEAKIVQDADRLDAIGAIGIARCFTTAGKLNRCFYDTNDPKALHREFNDQNFTVDHFAVKLNQLIDLMNTPRAKSVAQARVEFQIKYLEHLFFEIGFQS